MKTSVSLSLLAFVVLSCTPASKKEVPYDAAAHTAEVQTWYDHRLEELKAENGWLNLAGLYWLKDGMNTFGSAATNDLVFPEGMIAPRAGFFLLKDGQVQMTTMPGVTVTQNGVPVSKAVIFHPDSTRQPKLDHGTLRWSVIKRSEKYGIRLRDLQSPEVTHFKGIERYPVSQTWRLSAKFSPAPEGTMIPINNVLGQTTPTKSPGKVTFEVAGVNYTLDALENGPNELFIIFGDSTNASETYGAGRFLYTPRADSTGQVMLDFNRAENPPCAFTEFATCPLPPKQNVLPISIRAGEKNYGTH